MKPVKSYILPIAIGVMLAAGSTTAMAADIIFEVNNSSSNDIKASATENSWITVVQKNSAQLGTFDAAQFKGAVITLAIPDATGVFLPFCVVGVYPNSSNAGIPTSQVFMGTNKCSVNTIGNGDAGSTLTINVTKATLN